MKWTTKVEVVERFSPLAMTLPMRLVITASESHNGQTADSSGAIQKECQDLWHRIHPTKMPGYNKEMSIRWFLPTRHWRIASARI